MNSAKVGSILARETLAFILRGMTLQKAHWYCLYKPQDNTKKISTCFPSLSSLLCIEEVILLQLLTTSGLASYGKRGCTTKHSAWEFFFKEFMLDNEITHFNCLDKRRLLVRIGSWDNELHPRKKPVDLWTAALKKKLKVPRVHISSMLNDFTIMVGKVRAISQSIDEEAGEEKESDISSNENDEECSNSATQSTSSNRISEEGDGDLLGLSIDTNLPDAALFPMLNSLQIDNPSKMHALIREILKFHGKNTVEFFGANNRPRGLLVMPCLRSVERYDNEFAKKGSAVECLVQHIASHANCSPSDAAECVVRGLCKRYEESFAAVAIEKGITPLKRKMDEACVEAMLSEASINTANARILFRHLNQFFGYSYFASELKRRSYFEASDYPPTVDKEVLPDKTVIPFWYKEPHLLLQSQISMIIRPEDLAGLQKVDIAVGGDSGGGFFRMMLKVLFRFNSKPSVSRIFQIASVSYSKDDIEVFQRTVLNAIGMSLKLIVNGGHFTVSKGEDGIISLQFDRIIAGDNPVVCSVPVRLFMVGDLKYYMQMLGRDGMSSCWCVWCVCHPRFWKCLGVEPDSVPQHEKETWTIQKMVEHKEWLERENVKEPRQKKGIVGKPIWDFIEPKHYIFPVLHFEIGAVNNVLDSFYGFVEDRVELLSEEEKVLRSSAVIAEVAFSEAQRALSGWKETGAVNLAMHRIEKTTLVQHLRRTTLTANERQELTQQRAQLEAIINDLVKQRKVFEKQVTETRIASQEAKAALKSMQNKKSKSDKSVIADIENLLIDHNITAASYHGGKLHGVDCREMIRLAKDLFPTIENILLATEHPDVCDALTIKNTCKMYCDIFVTLDTISSKLRIKHGEVTADDVKILEDAMVNLDYLWGKTDLSVTPKIHSAIAHAVSQVKELEGIGDILEDDLEHLHQTSAKITACVSRMKNKDQQAFVHSKREAIHNNVEVRKRVQSSLDASKRQFKKRNMELDSNVRATKAKKERDDSRIATLHDVLQKPHTITLQKRHDIDKDDYLQSTTGNAGRNRGEV